MFNPTKAPRTSLGLIVSATFIRETLLVNLSCVFKIKIKDLLGQSLMIPN